VGRAEDSSVAGAGGRGGTGGGEHDWSGFEAERADRAAQAQTQSPAERHAGGRGERSERLLEYGFQGLVPDAGWSPLRSADLSDVHSRYLFRCQALAAADTLHCKPVFEAAFREYGLPDRMRTDNGAPFGANGDSGLTALSVWWIRLGIQPERIQPAHPEQNGRHERMHRTLKEATASPPAQNRRRQQEQFDAFRREYNEERPHEALGQTPPAEHYQPSPRTYPERLAAIEYPAEWQVRRVSPSGQMRWQCDYVFVAHALEGQAVGLQPIGDSHWKVYFSFYEIGVLDTECAKIWSPEQWRKRCQRGTGGTG